MYVGDGGVLLALCRAGELLGDAEVLHHAATLAHDLAAMPVSGPDVYNGAAGRCRALVRAADTLGSTAAHGAAIALGDHLLATAISDGDGMYWVPPGEEHPGGTIGYAHGAAGIGDVLLELGERGHQRFTDAALSAARWVMRWRVDSGESVAFPATPGNGPWNPFWCHGATGVGRFAVRLHRRGLLDDPGLLRGIAHATSRLGRCSAPSMCHGLAGAIDHLIDQYQSTGDDAHLDEAWGLSSLLEGFEREGADGHLRSLTEGGPTPSFDLSIGYSGTAAAWLRLADPSRPTLVD
jgi:lantibiotic modifying enzyme